MSMPSERGTARMTSTPSKATAGPWRIDGPKHMDINGRVHRIVDSDRYPAAFVPAWDMPGPGEIDGKDEALANARLIAAAPDLLAALENLSKLYDSIYVEMNGPTAEMCNAAWKLADAAISRATGEA